MKLLSIALACLLLQTASAQNFPNIYRDVLALQKTMNVTVFKTDSTSLEIYLPILRRYFVLGETRKLEEVKMLLEKSENPFGISEMIQETKSTKPSTEEEALLKWKKMLSEIKSTPPEVSGAGSVPFLSAPVIASAITNLVIKRAKQELTVSFFNKFKTELEKPGLNLLFPKTTELISNIETYLYASYLNTLRAAFAEDITALVTTVPGYLRSDSISSRILKDPSRYTLWLSIPVLDGLGSLFAGGSLAEAIQKLRPNQPVIINSVGKKFSQAKNMYNTLELLYMLSEAVRDETGVTNWISADTFYNNIMKDPVSTRLFYGLLYEKIRPLSFTLKDSTETKLTTVINIGQEKIDVMNNTIRILLQGYKQAADAMGTLQTIGKPVDENLYKTAMGVVTNISNTLTNSSRQINRLIALRYPAYEAKTDSIFRQVATLTALVGNLYEKQYAAAVMNSTLLINRYLPKDTTTERLLKYGSLAASIVESKNAEDISAALDAAILPTGSSSIKQHTSWSVSINSYIGANLYRESYKNAAVKNEKTCFNTFGISLPVGVAFTKGLRNKWMGSLSLFASILDLGAVASYQLSTPDSITSKQLPDFTWKNLLAPGGFIVLGRLFNTPLSVGIGAQKGPALRSISYKAGGTTLDLSDQLSWRTGVFLAVDIPFFNLYSRPYAKSTR